MSKISIIGDGTVGRALGKNMGIKPLGPSDEDAKADVVIICVPTENMKGKQDISCIKQALSRIKKAKLIILRSTVLPGTTEKLQRTIDIPMIFIPEFGFEDTMEKDLKEPSFYLLGFTSKSNTIEIIQLIYKILPQANHYEFMRAISAEFAKYFSNIWGSSQVVLANSLYDWVINQTNNPDIYDEAMRISRLKENMPDWGWNIHDKGKRGYGGKCLPKDIKAAISQYPHKLWQEMERYNDTLF